MKKYIKIAILFLPLFMKAQESKKKVHLGREHQIGISLGYLNAGKVNVSYDYLICRDGSLRGLWVGITVANGLVISKNYLVHRILPILTTTYQKTDFFPLIPHVKLGVGYGVERAFYSKSNSVLMGDRDFLTGGVGVDLQAGVKYALGVDSYLGIGLEANYLKTSLLNTNFLYSFSISFSKKIF